MCKMPFSVPETEAALFLWKSWLVQTWHLRGPCPTSRSSLVPRCPAPVLGCCCAAVLTQDSAVARRHCGGGSLHAAWALSPAPLTPVCLPCSARLLTPHSPQSEALSSQPVCWSSERPRSPLQPQRPPAQPSPPLPAPPAWERASPAWLRCSCAHIQRETLTGGTCGFHKRQMQALSAFASRRLLARTDPGPPWLRVVRLHLPRSGALLGFPVP